MDKIFKGYEMNYTKQQLSNMYPPLTDEINNKNSEFFLKPKKEQLLELCIITSLYHEETYEDKNK